MKFVMPVIISILTAFNSYGQDYGMGKQKIGRPSRWAIGVMGSPDFQGRFIIPVNNEQGKEAAALLRRAEKPGFGFTTGLHIQYDLKSRWFMRMGFYYSDKSVVQDGAVTGFRDAPGFVRYTDERSKAPFAFMEFPLTFHYFLNTPFEKNKQGLCFNDYTQHNQGKPLFYVFAGPALAINLAKHIYYTRNWTTISDFTYSSVTPVYADPMSVYYLGGYAGIGVLKYFGQHWFASAEITGRYFPFQWYGKEISGNNDVDPETGTPSVISYPVKDQPFSVGLQLAINYHF